MRAVAEMLRDRKILNIESSKSEVTMGGKTEPFSLSKSLSLKGTI